MSKNGSREENKKCSSVDEKGKVYSKILRQEARGRFPGLNGNGKKGICEEGLREPRG